MSAGAAVAVDTGVVERAKDLVPLLRQNALKADRDRRLPPETVAPLADAGVPRPAGGEA